MTVSTDQLLAHRPAVARLAAALAHDASSADDLLQETFLAALSRPPHHADGLVGWLATVIRRQSWKETRGEHRRSARERVAARHESLPGADVAAARAETERAVLDAVLELPELLRGTVLLHYFEGVSTDEIARRSGVPASTVRSRLRLARERLRRPLRPHASSILALAPVAALDGSPTVPGVSLAAPGVLLMSTTTKIAAAAAVVFAGLAGYVVADRDPAPAVDAEELVALRDRVAELERDAERRSRTEEADRRTIAHLQDRVLDVERSALAAPRDGTTPPESGPRPGRPRGNERKDSTALNDEQAAREAEAMANEMEAARAAAMDLAARQADLVALRGRVTAMKLRQLPEEQRWEKITELLGLNGGQLQHVKDAVGRRDAEWGDATDLTVEPLDTGGFRKTTEVDEQRLEAADTRFDSELQQILTKEQLESWQKNTLGMAVGSTRPRDLVYETPTRDGRR